MEAAERSGARQCTSCKNLSLANPGSGFEAIKGPVLRQRKILGLLPGLLPIAHLLGVPSGPEGVGLPPCVTYNSQAG
ncbi:MAG: hypothetical protein QXQ53_01765 [Candidatus Methanosuratincola sp.]